MAQPCERREACDFFKACCLGFAQTRAEWDRLFCGCLTRSQRCERKKYLLASGCKPPVNMAPTGRFL